MGGDGSKMCINTPNSSIIVYNGFDLDRTLIFDHTETNGIEYKIKEEQDELHKTSFSKYTILEKPAIGQDPTESVIHKFPVGRKERETIYRCNAVDFENLNTSYKNTVLPAMLQKYDNNEDNWKVELVKIEDVADANGDIIPIRESFADSLHKYGTNADITNALKRETHTWFYPRCVQARPHAMDLVRTLDEAPHVRLFFWTAGKYAKKRAVIEWLVGRKLDLSQMFFGEDTVSPKNKGGPHKHFQRPIEQPSYYRKDMVSGQTVQQLLGAKDASTISFVDDTIKDNKVSNDNKGYLIDIRMFSHWKNGTSSDDWVSTLRGDKNLMMCRKSKAIPAKIFDFNYKVLDEDAGTNLKQFMEGRQQNRRLMSKMLLQAY